MGNGTFRVPAARRFVSHSLVMDLNYSAEELAFRDEASAWLRDNLPAELREKVTRYRSLSKDDLLRWHKILAAKGWIAPAWPQEWGGTGWNVVKRYIFEEACGYAGTPPLIPAIPPRAAAGHGSRRCYRASRDNGPRIE